MHSNTINLVSGDTRKITLRLRDPETSEYMDLSDIPVNVHVQYDPPLTKSAVADVTDPTYATVELSGSELVGGQWPMEVEYTKDGETITGNRTHLRKQVMLLIDQEIA